MSQRQRRKAPVLAEGRIIASLKSHRARKAKQPVENRLASEAVASGVVR